MLKWLGHKVVDIPSSKMKRAITEILFNKGYILNYKFEETKNKQGNIKISIKYIIQKLISPLLKN